MKMIMKKETSDNILREKMEVFDEANAMNIRNYQPVWDRLENKLHPKNKQKTNYFYFVAAAILLVILAGFIIRYQLNDKPTTHLVIEELPIKKNQQILQINLASDTFVHPAKPRQSKLTLNSRRKKKTFISAPDKDNPEVTMQNNKATTPIVISKQKVVNNNLAESSSAIVSQMNSILAASPKKPVLKMLHINEIYHGNVIKPTETIKQPSVNWLFTTNHKTPEIREANNDYLPVIRKKFLFSIPLQKQNSN